MLVDQSKKIIESLEFQFLIWLENTKDTRFTQRLFQVGYLTYDWYTTSEAWEKIAFFGMAGSFLGLIFGYFSGFIG